MERGSQDLRSCLNKHTLKNSSESKSRSKSKSRLSSIDESPNKLKSPTSNKKYVYCKDCKRRRQKRRTLKHTINKDDEEEEQKEKVEGETQQDKDKLTNESKFIKSQSTILVSNIRKKFGDPGEESDFKVDESIYSAASLDSVYSWGYGKH